MNTTEQDPLAIVAAPNPTLPKSSATELLTEYWGMTAELSPLVSERDQNFRVVTPDGSRFVLKIANSAERPDVTTFQIDALRHIANRSDDSLLVVPRVMPTVSGQYSINQAYGDETHKVRLVSWVDGKFLGNVVPSLNLCGSIGRGLAWLGRWLADFRHPGENQSLLWDMKRAVDLRRHLPLLEERPEMHANVTAALDDFEKIATPAMQEMRWQVIHNDAHPDNFVVGEDDSERMIGIIDFGDMMFSPLIVDLGVCAAYLRGGDSHPLAKIAAFVGGYQEVTPLQDAELEMLYYLVRARLAATISIARWRASARAADDPYLAAALDEEEAAAIFLARVNQFTAQEFLAAIS